MNSFDLSKDGRISSHQEGSPNDFLQYEFPTLHDGFWPLEAITSTYGSPENEGLVVDEYHTLPRSLPGDGLLPTPAWPETTPKQTAVDTGWQDHYFPDALWLNGSGGDLPPPRTALSISQAPNEIPLPMETEDSKVREKPQHSCHVCQQGFDSSQLLEVHAKAELHKPYQCDVCPKSYSRRDVLLRHKAMHKDASHQCPYCPKATKRKDKLKDHIRTCHSDRDSAASTRSTSLSEPSQDLPSFVQLVQKLKSDTESDFSLSEADDYASAQKDKMRAVVKSLCDLLGDHNQSLINKLNSSVEDMNGSSMELLAQNMACMAVMHANLSAVRPNCP